MAKGNMGVKTISMTLPDYLGGQYGHTDCRYFTTVLSMCSVPFSAYEHEFKMDEYLVNSDTFLSDLVERQHHKLFVDTLCSYTLYDLGIAYYIRIEEPSYEYCKLTRIDKSDYDRYTFELMKRELTYRRNL